MVSRCTNPNRIPNDRRDTERSILLPSFIEEIRPTRSARRRAEREVNVRRRRARRRGIQRHLLPPRTGPSIPTGSLTPSSSEGLNNRAESNHGLPVLENYTPATQAHVPVEPDDSTQKSYGAEHEAFTATLQAATSESYDQDPNSASASRTIDFDIPRVDDEYVFLEPDTNVSQVDAGIPSTVRDLVLNSSREYEDHFQPRNMNQIQLGDHIDDVSREAQQRMPLPDLNPDANDPSVRMTFENGDVSHDKVYFDDELEHSFISYDYLWRIRAASGRLPYVIEAPPIDRETLTPGGVLAPIKYLLYADLDWESSGLPFPRSQLYFIIYRGNGTVYDTKPVLGRDWSEMVERQAPSGA